MGTFANPPLQLWTDEYLSDLATEAEIQISTEVPCIYTRFPMNVTVGTSIYGFQDANVMPFGPIRLTGIIRITWQGWTVHPVFQNQLRNIVIPLAPENGDPQSSRPFMYMRSGYGIDGIKFYPSPSATITYDNSDITTQDSIAANVIVSGWTIANPEGQTLRVPAHVRATLVRYYVMERAYRKEGRGQNMEASKYYAQKYSKLLTRFKTITSQLFASRTHGMGDMFLSIYGRKPPHPKLPTNFPDNGQW
jgi:hypothetical protein